MSKKPKARGAQRYTSTLTNCASEGRVAFGHKWLQSTCCTLPTCSRKQHTERYSGTRQGIAGPSKGPKARRAWKHFHLDHLDHLDHHVLRVAYGTKGTKPLRFYVSHPKEWLRTPCFWFFRRAPKKARSSQKETIFFTLWFIRSYISCFERWYNVKKVLQPVKI